MHELALSFSQPALIFGHFTYLLLIVSMLMRNIVWLRSIAIAAGIAKIIYRTLIMLDPVSVLWETIFVLVNVAELGVIWWRSRPPLLRDEERLLLDAVAPNLSVPARKALLARAEWRDVPAGETLTRQGVPVGGLIYVAAGQVDIIADGRTIGQCKGGDFLGEMTWADGGAATATAITVGPARYAWFERRALSSAVTRLEGLRFALQASISRNLTQKLLRASGHAAV
jgi:hypothetical protein